VVQAHAYIFFPNAGVATGQRAGLLLKRRAFASHNQPEETP
jgi:succinylglutamate desuccinylase